MGRNKDIATTLNSFFRKIEKNSYAMWNVPTDATYPYLAYALPTGDIFYKTILGLRIRTNNTNLTEGMEVVDKIDEAIGNGVKLTLPNGSGYLAIYKSSPFSQLIEEDLGDNVKTFYVNIEIQYY